MYTCLQKELGRIQVGDMFVKLHLMGLQIKFVRYGNQSTDVWAAWDTLETEAGSQAKVDTHSEDVVKHITSTERTSWQNKVDKITGKGLSTNDYSTTEKTKLNGIAPGANNYSLPATACIRWRN